MYASRVFVAARDPSFIAFKIAHSAGTRRISQPSCAWLSIRSFGYGFSDSVFEVLGSGSTPHFCLSSIDKSTMRVMGLYRTRQLTQDTIFLVNIIKNLILPNGALSYSSCSSYVVRYCTFDIRNAFGPTIIAPYTFR
jgi:hypothetical protein